MYPAGELQRGTFIVSKKHQSRSDMFVILHGFVGFFLIVLFSCVLNFYGF